MPTLLERWLGRGRKAGPPLAVTVYTRASCCCCHKALEVLRAAGKRWPLAIDEVDVDGDPALVEAFGDSVPVVMVGGKARFRGVVNPTLLERLLEAESRGA